MSERSTFSPFWHRVRTLRPRLRPHVQITRQHYRGRRWHVVHDPSSNQFFRLNAVAHEFVGLLDGHRTVEDVWNQSLTRHADDALTQNEVIQLLSQLYAGNLLAADVSPEAEQLLGRGRDRLMKRIQAQAVGLMYFRLRIFNPDRLLTWLEPIFRPVLGKVGLVLWAVWVIAALVAILPHFRDIVSRVDTAIAPGNWGWLAVGFVAIKLFHELGHGLICKRFGGQVPEFGVMLLVLFPSPFVDASSSWAFRSKWQRIAVGAGGMIFELTLAALAAWVWLNTDEAALAHRLAYNAMLTASVSTVLFNANPLMKFDGYYILSDLLEVPNLMQRAQTMLKFLMQRHVFRLRQTTAPTSNVDEALILLLYGTLSGIYRVFLFVSITMYVMGMAFGLGVFLAFWTAGVWFILPAGALVHWLATSPQIAERRGRVILTTLLLFALGLAGIGAVPAPDRRRADGVVESEERSGVFAGADGFVDRVYVVAGERVTKGQPLFVLRSEQLQAQAKLYRAQLDEAECRLRLATQKDQVAAQIADEYVRMLREQLAYSQKRIEALVVTAPQDGVVVGDDPQKAIGRYIREGHPLCEIVDAEHLHVVAALPQTEASWVSRLPSEQWEVELRPHCNVRDVVEATTQRVVDAGQLELPHPALSYLGGGKIELSPEDNSGRVAKQQFFKAYFVTKDAGAQIGPPGERVAVRVSLPRRPLLAQWIDRLAKLTQGRAKL